MLEGGDRATDPRARGREPRGPESGVIAMLEGVDRLIDLVGTRAAGLTGASETQVAESTSRCDADALAQTDGHFAAVGRDGKTVRLARTIGIPLRYFVAKM